MSVSEPSWLFGKTWISTRPLVCCLMRSIASMVRTVSGCVTGELLAYLNWNSAAPLAIQGMPIVAVAAVPASRTERRVVLSVILNPPIVFGARRDRFCTRPLQTALGFHHGRAAGARQGSSRAVALSNRGGTVHDH